MQNCKKYALQRCFICKSCHVPDLKSEESTFTNPAREFNNLLYREGTVVNINIKRGDHCSISNTGPGFGVHSMNKTWCEQKLTVSRGNVTSC
jgi:hypothetical protein